MKKLRCASVFMLLLAAYLLPLPEAGLADVNPVPIKKDDKCRVCGMFVAKYSTWAAEIVFKDGTFAAFDGPKDMFRYYLNIRRYEPSKQRSDIAAIFVTEYYSTKMMDAHSVTFIQGSDVLGPMGHELVPIASAENAKEFMKDHKGKKTLKFDAVTLEDLK